MLEESFIFLPGVRERTEQRLWAQGIRTWDHLLDATRVKGVGGARLTFWKGRIRELRAHLQGARGLPELRRLLGNRYAWRASKQILAEPRYVDIETTEYGEITLLGVSDGEFYEGFVRGKNLTRADVQRAFKGATCLVTFNGSSFDLPIIERRYPGVLPDVPHLDLRHMCAQVGLKGGLKRIEEVLQIRRAEFLRDVDGSDAILLWYRHQLGDPEALKELVDYNAADVLNMVPLLEMVLPALWQKVRRGDTLLLSQRT